jgi:hypothetical protein
VAVKVAVAVGVGVRDGVKVRVGVAVAVAVAVFEGVNVIDAVKLGVTLGNEATVGGGGRVMPQPSVTSASIRAGTSSTNRGNPGSLRRMGVLTFCHERRGPPTHQFYTFPAFSARRRCKM